jgi:DNA-binding transcriptional regulator GbsR (MarR family)
MRSVRTDERTERFIEQMGMLGEEEGLPRIAGRIFGFLLLQSEPCSLDDLADVLGVSKASVSTDTRRLEGLGYLERKTMPGDRRDYYSISPDVFAHSLRLRLDRMRKFHELIEQAGRLPNKDADVRNRLEQLEAAYQVAVASVVEVLETWEQSRVAETSRRR